MTYLFFDIECANNFGGIGKICSFGYVLCREDFSVIESDDFLMNPDAPFDWYLFKPGSKCQLAYSREEYRARPTFPHYYAKLASLLAAKERLVLGFGCANDVATIASECARYALTVPAFACHDIHQALEQQYAMQGSLGAFVQALEIPTKGMEFHDSRADAYFTMKVTDRLCADSKKPLAELLAPYTPATGEQALVHLQKKLFRKWREREEAAKAAAAGDGAKPRRVPKKLSVPAWFDWRAEMLAELKAQKESAR